MKVVIIMESLALGGAEQSLIYQLPALSKLGYTCHVAALCPPYPLQPRLEAAGIAVHPLNVLDRRNPARAARAIARLCKTERFDLAHAKLFHPSLALGLSKTMGPKIPRVVSFHNLAYEYPISRLRKTVTRTVEGTLLRNGIDGFAALSRAVADSYGRALGIDGIRVVPNAVPTTLTLKTPETQARARAAFGLQDTPPIIAMPARLVMEKGHRIFIDALARMQAQQVPFQAIIAGNGPEQANIEAYLQHRGLQDALTFLKDGLDHAQALELMRAADVVAVPSFLEGFGLAPAEAMALGTPVVASAVGGLTDLIEPEKSGLLVPAKDPVALATAMTRLVTDEALRARLIPGGRARVETHFSPERVAELWHALYRDVAAA